MCERACVERSPCLPGYFCRLLQSLPDTAELNQPLHEYTQMESCAQLTGEIGAPASTAPPRPPLGQTAAGGPCTGAEEAQLSWGRKEGVNEPP